MRLPETQHSHAFGVVLEIVFDSRVVFVRLVVRAEGVRSVDDRQRAFDARHVGWSLLPFAGDQVRFCAAPDLLSSALGTFSQQIPEAIAVGDFFCQLNHRFGIAPREVQSIRVIKRQYPRVEGLERPRDGCPA